MFRPVSSEVRFPALETEVIQFWKEQRIYEQSLAQRAGAPPFIFFEGPPTANGMPHPGHCLTRAIKDLFPRYRTMRGYHCERKAGWDTHGLPVEVEVCKALGIHSKEDIENYGVEPFIHKCQESVWRYMQEWEKLTERLGFWVDLEKAYVTYHQSYVESVWWALKTMFDRGLLYQGHKIVWWWAQGGTALSSGEVGQGYRQVADPSVYVKFPLLTEQGQPTETSLVVWTTTPWTLPSNQFAAVKSDLEYAEVTDPEVPGKLIMAAALVDVIAAKVKRKLDVVRTFPGSELVGRRYVPPFDCYYKDQGRVVGPLAEVPTTEIALAWRVVAADFVTTESGSGVVHQAPAFGEVDYQVLVAEQAKFVPGTGPELINAVGPDGKFTDAVPTYTGRWVKDCDKDITRELRTSGLLYHFEQYLHDYPFCWRAPEDALIQYPRKSWFVRTTQFREAMLENNEHINWLPEHIKHGRFGNFLESNVDWALSRERFWGTPLPVWQCEATGYQEAVGGYKELLAKPGLQGTEVWAAAKAAKPDLSDDLQIHKPYVDALTYDSPKQPGARMRRVTEVIDCWFDSGAMPFAQWGYPHQGQTEFAAQFPADFISEALDQTRGWFYSLVAISTLLFGKEGTATTTTAGGKETVPHAYPLPFKNCIVLGLMLGEDGTKMSKSKRNYREPKEIFDKYGADALRWFFYANQPPWSEILYKEQAIRDSIPEFLLRLQNVYSFFGIYANIDGFDPAQSWTGPSSSQQVDDLPTPRWSEAASYRPVAERNELDRWILGELDRTACGVVAALDAYDNYGACKHLNAFVDVLSNWYVRRSRKRYWASGQSQDKTDAYWTLYECLVTTSKLVAPFTPFLAETIWQNLVREPFGDRARQSVHLADYPTGTERPVNVKLSQQMALVLDIVSLGRSARSEAKLKVRQPLGKVEVILGDPQHQAWLAEHAGLIAEELNVKQVEFATQAEQYINYTVLPDLKKLGPRLGKQLPLLKKALSAADPAKLVREMEQQGRVELDLGGTPLPLTSEELLVRLEAKPGWAAAHSAQAVVVLSTEVTPELVLEGLARELAHAVQTRRKELQCAYTDRIRIGVVSPHAEVISAVQNFGDYIAGETLAVELQAAALPVEAVELTLSGFALQLYVTRAQ